MYIPVGNRLIVQKPKERKTDSGIILAEQDDGPTFEFMVIATPEEHKRFAGKTIIVERRYVFEIEDKIGAVDIQNILAIKEK